ncbi:site-2 protease family protein [bacterium]|nr:site-2 protease family protein [bacterium]
MLDILFQNPIVFVFLIGALVISLSIHEFAHAYIATRLGDDTPKHLGRVTLDPRAHLDPLGTILLIVAGFGWGKPVPFNPINLKNPKKDSALIAIAGPASNFLLAGVLTVVYHIIGRESLLGVFLFFTIYYNLVLGVFNLVPLHPLDGFKVVRGFLPHNLVWQWDQVKQYGVFILMVLVFTRSIGLIISPILGFFTRILGL